MTKYPIADRTKTAHVAFIKDNLILTSINTIVILVFTIIPYQ